MSLPPESGVIRAEGTVGGMYASAVLSRCGKYRYRLCRYWSEGVVGVVLMHNPSTADHLNNDPTIRRLIQWHQRWGFGGIEVVNVLPVRTPSPREALQWFAQACVSPDQAALHRNLHYIQAAGDGGRQVLLAHGNLATDVSHYADMIIDDLRSVGARLVCVGKTQSGAPMHPMARGRHRVPDDVMPMEV